MEIARHFLVMGPYLALTMLVIEGDIAMFSVYGDTSGRGTKFKLVSQSQTERKYIATDTQDLSKGILTVTILSGENIRVSKQNDPLGAFVLWKRAPPQSIQKHVQALDDTPVCLASVSGENQKIISLPRTSSKRKSVPPCAGAKT